MQGAGEVATQAGEADLQIACEGGSPALLEDRAVQPFDVAVGLRATGADAGVRDIFGELRTEGLASELVAVV